MWSILKIQYSEQRLGGSGPDHIFLVFVDKHHGNATIRKLGAAADNIGDPSYQLAEGYQEWLQELRIQGIPYTEVSL